MARVHYWHYLLNEEGQPVEDALISVQQAETSTYLWIYDVEEGGTAFCNYERVGSTGNAQLRTDPDGFFEFWVADAADATYGYSGIKIKIVWSKEGVITSDSVDYIEFSTSPQPVDETDSDTAKNKLVSNNLAKNWETASKHFVQLKCIDWATTVSAITAYYFIVPEEWDGMNLVRADAFHVTASTGGATGATTIRIYNVRSAQSMFSTSMTIDAEDKSTRDALTPSVINATYDDVATGDILQVEVTALVTGGTGPKGLMVDMVFELPQPV